jgi:putative hemolysin
MVLLLITVLRPIISLVDGMSSACLWLLRHQRHHKKVFVTRQELRAILDESVHKGIFSTKEKQLIDTVFDFEHKTVKDKMRAIAAVKKIDINDPLARVKALAATSTRTRFLVDDKKTGAILGYVNIFDILFEGQAGGTVKDFLRTPVFLPEMTTLREAFETLRDRREWILFAVGAQDKVTGILALNDILNF